jgi:hypothetical protein
MHEVIAIVVIALSLFVAAGAARLGTRMIGGGSNKEALRDLFAAPRRLPHDISERRTRRRARRH